MRKRIKLCDRKLPSYTKGEEVMNMVTHIVGGSIGILVLVLCVIKAITNRNTLGVIGAAVYGGCMVALYCMSSVYHGLHPSTGKKVMQVIDHCTIYLLIAGTYTPVMLCAVRPISPGWAWTIMGFVWGCALVAATLTAIDLKKYAKFSMICYIGMGWCVVLAIKPTMQAVPLAGLLWLLFGGISYTVGAVLYGLGKKHRYMHSIFHVFVVAGSVLQYIAILFFIL